MASMWTVVVLWWWRIRAVVPVRCGMLCPFGESRLGVLTYVLPRGGRGVQVDANNHVVSKGGSYSHAADLSFFDTLDKNVHHKPSAASMNDAVYDFRFVQCHPAMLSQRADC